MAKDKFRVVISEYVFESILDIYRGICYDSLPRSSAMIKADLMKTIEMPSDSMHEDYYCWLTLLKQGYCGYGINEPLLTYRMGQNTKSSSRLKSARMNFNTYRAVGYSWIEAMYHMCRYALYSLKKRRKIVGI